MNLSSLETNTVEAASGEKISPLGFVNGDFIYGKMKMVILLQLPALKSMMLRNC